MGCALRSDVSPLGGEEIGDVRCGDGVGLHDGVDAGLEGGVQGLVAVENVNTLISEHRGLKVDDRPLLLKIEICSLGEDRETVRDSESKRNRKKSRLGGRRR